MGDTRVHRRVLRGRGGVPFVEVLLGTFVAVAAGTGILGSYLSCQSLTEHARQTMIAMNDLKAIMERMQATPFTNLQVQFPATVPNGPAANLYTNIVGGYVLQNETVTATYPSIGTGRLEVLLTLTWNQNGRARTATLTTIRTDT